MNHLMTSSHHTGDDKTVMWEASALAEALRNRGFEVVRVKVESTKNHPNAPKEYGDKMPEGHYFETHIPLKLDPDEISRLSEVEMTGARVSRNVFKKCEDGKVIIMVTLRLPLNLKIFEKELSNLLSKLALLDFAVTEDPVIEFSVFDSNLQMDQEWIDGRLSLKEE